MRGLCTAAVDRNKAGITKLLGNSAARAETTELKEQIEAHPKTCGRNSEQGRAYLRSVKLLTAKIKRTIKLLEDAT